MLLENETSAGTVRRQSPANPFQRQVIARHGLIRTRGERKGAALLTLRADDKRERELAARIERAFPRWMVHWGAYSRQFWGYPRFSVSRGTIAHAASPDDLVGMMRAIQQSAQGGRR